MAFQHSNFVTMSDGSLQYSEYIPGQGFTWRHVRNNYSMHYREIKNTVQLKASLRAGDALWPGCYAFGYLTSDCGVICPDCVRRNLYSVIHSMRHNISDGWKVEGIIAECDTDDVHHCDHCDKLIFGEYNDGDSE